MCQDVAKLFLAELDYHRQVNEKRLLLEKQEDFSTVACFSLLAKMCGKSESVGRVSFLKRSS